MNLKTLQKMQKQWVDHNFAGQPPWHAVLGVVEEVGELSHAHLKSCQGIRGSADGHRKKIADAIGDIVIFLASYCNAAGFDLNKCVTEAWNVVRQRDWKAVPNE